MAILENPATATSATGSDILELRIHGVRNDPPANILGADASDVELVSGDKLAGFYTVSVSAAPGLKSWSTIPAGVRREAYSWGQLNRFTPSFGGKLLGKIGMVLMQIAWLLLVPFGLCNVAYWARPLPGHNAKADELLNPRSLRKEEPVAKGGWRTGNGAAASRLFALVLTLLYATSFASVALDLIAVQCFTPSTDPKLPGQQACSQLPAFFDFLASWDRGQRLAALSLIPIVAIVILYLVSVSARVRYEANVARTGPDTTLRGDGDVPRVPVLSTPRFWNHRFLSTSTERLHLAAAVTFIALLLFWDREYAGNAGCAANPFQATCRMQWNGGAPVGLISSTLVGALIVALVVVRTAAASDVRTPAKLVGKSHKDFYTIAALLLATAAYAFAVVVEATAGAVIDDEGRRFSGLIVAPTALVATAFVLAVAGLGWRRGVRTGISASLALAFFTGGALLLVAGRQDAGHAPLTAWIGVAAVAVALAGWILIWIFTPRRGTAPASEEQGFEYQAWRGAGPGIIMFLALGASMILGGLIVVGTATYLTQPLGAKQATADGFWRVTPPASAAKPSPIVTPSAYVTFGVVLVLIAATLMIAIAIVLAVRFRHLWAIAAPGAAGHPVPQAQLTDYYDCRRMEDFSGGRDITTGKPPVVRVQEPRAARVILTMRRLAALAHVGVPTLTVVAVTTALGILLTLFLTVFGYLYIRTPQGTAVTDPVVDKYAPSGLVNTADTIAAWALGTTALLAVAAIVAAAFTATTRPLGLLWDLISFLPRAGHPFGPPCYAARSVPELQGRIEEWLHPVDGSERPGRRVIISAHSQGAVLAVAVVLSMRTCKKDDVIKVGLLTYGVQLRAYFGRFFPELLGPSATGGRPCRGPSPFKPDPWLNQFKLDRPRLDEGNVPANAPVAAAFRKSITVKSSLTRTIPGAPVRWINLWRRTDFIGFPADSYGTSSIDVGADELDRTSYLLAAATHFNYPSSAAYEEQFGRLSEMLT